MTNAFWWGVRDLGHIDVCVCVHRTVWVRFFIVLRSKLTSLGSKYKALFRNVIMENII